VVRADFITGIAITLLALAVIVLSLEMPRFEDRNVNPYTVPGLVPGALGVILALLSVVLTVRAARGGGWRMAAFSGPIDPVSARRVGLTLVLTLVYAAVLVGQVPFWLATFLFVLAFVLVFEWARGPAGRLRRALMAALYAAALAAAVSYVFQELFLVRLP
jgi:hypothetical protein